ncbi:MAG: serine/threonine protein kinase [Bacteroidales bacterium]|nr:serine/threonine protein kinase [Bacteroidales bacterium]
MSIEIMKMLIQSACGDGTLTDADRTLLEKKASDFGISKDKLNKMIEAELNGTTYEEPSAEQTSNENLEGSGFVTEAPQPAPQPQPEPQPELEGSGFVTEAPQPPTPPTPPAPPQQAPTKSSTSFSQASFAQSTAVSSRFTDVKPMSSQGAMSTVYQGKQYGKWIIIKRIKPQFKDNEDYKSLFFKEFENAYHLDHPNIVRILDKGEDEEGAFYTMEYVDGQSLTDLIKTGRTVKDERLTKKLFSQMLDALSYVHKKQIIHRDLKPDNMIVTYRGDNVKILDFGLASADYFDDNLVKVGTPKYAAPEQMTKGNEVDQRADIYALGLILLEMTTGSLNDKNADTVKNPNFQEIIRKSTKQDREERFYDCQEVMEVLNRPITATPPAASVPPPPPPKVETPKPTTPPPAPAPQAKKTEIVEEKKKSKAPLIIILLLLLLGLVAGVFFLFLIDDDETTDVDNNNPAIEAPVDNNQGTNNQNNNQGNNKSNNNPQPAPQPQPEPTPTPAPDNQQNEEDAELSALTKQGNACFDDKNVARALTYYNKALALKADYAPAKEKAAKCNEILKATSTKNLSQKRGASPDGADKLGFVDANGYVLIDYLYEACPNGFQTDYGICLQKEKNGKYGFIANSTKLPCSEFIYNSVYAQPAYGFSCKDSSGKRWKIDLKGEPSVKPM